MSQLSALTLSNWQRESPCQRSLEPEPSLEVIGGGLGFGKSDSAARFLSDVCLSHGHSDHLKQSCTDDEVIAKVVRSLIYSRLSYATGTCFLERLALLPRYQQRSVLVSC